MQLGKSNTFHCVSYGKIGICQNTGFSEIMIKQLPPAADVLRCNHRSRQRNRPPGQANQPSNAMMEKQIMQHKFRGISDLVQGRSRVRISSSACRALVPSRQFQSHPRRRPASGCYETLWPIDGLFSDSSFSSRANARI